MNLLYWIRMFPFMLFAIAVPIQAISFSWHPRMRSNFIAMTGRISTVHVGWRFAYPTYPIPYPGV